MNGKMIDLNAAIDRVIAANKEASLAMEHLLSILKHSKDIPIAERAKVFDHEEMQDNFRRLDYDMVFDKDDLKLVESLMYNDKADVEGQEIMPEKRVVEFLYDMDQKVATPFDEVGIIDMLGVDDGGIKYHVKTKASSNWFKEDELVPG